MRTFRVLCSGTDGVEVRTVDADFVEKVFMEVRFMVKPHWWNRKRCVATFDPRFVIGVESNAPAENSSDEKILKKWGVKA